MLRTITLGSCVFVQGAFEGDGRDGRIVVRVGDRVYEGRPVTKRAA